jgi:tellurite resistance-related uncharacterized protein
MTLNLNTIFMTLINISRMPLFLKSTMPMKKYSKISTKASKK